MIKKVATKKESELFARVRDILESARASVARSVNTAQVVANWLIGREIVEAEQGGKKRADYGSQLLSELSESLTESYGKGYSVDNLEAFRLFYLVYPELISETPSRKSSSKVISATVSRKLTNRSKTPLLPATPDISAVLSESAAHGEADFSYWKAGRLHPNLSWSHYRTLLKVSRDEPRAFYEVEAINNAWSVRELTRQIASLLFERLAKSRDKKGLMKLTQRGQEVTRPTDIFKDPVVMEFLDLPESTKLVESELEQALIDNLQHFLLELGKGFAFVARQQRISLDGDHFYIDLVFYHTILKCHVLIDLKVGKLTHGDLGQMQLYVNYYDRERRSEGDNSTLGLILCPDKNDAVVKYTLAPDQKIFASRYQTYLPSEAELQQELRREMRFLGALKESEKIKPAKKKAAVNKSVAEKAAVSQKKKAARKATTKKTGKAKE